MVSYILILKLDKDKTIGVGSLGEISFKKGYYMYVGSAKNSLKRIERHFKNEKKLRWHIDYLTVNSKVENALLLQNDECRIAKKLSEYFEKIEKFGCSDCKCKSHLFYSAKEPYGLIKKLFKALIFYR